MADLILEVGGDLRPLEKEIRRVSRKGINPLNERGFTQPLGRITGQIGEFEKALEASNARVLAFGASAGALVAVQQGFQAILHATVDVEKKLADINVILNVSSKNLEKFSSSLFGVARTTASSFDDVAEAATELARQGLTVEQTLKRTQDALILTRLSGLAAADSVEAITAALNSFSRAALDSSTFVSKLAAVDAAFAVSSKDLAEAVKRVGSSAIEAGLGIDELIAAVTSAQQITARGGAVIGNSFKTIFTRIQRPRVIKELENLGIAVKGIGGSVKPAMQILQELANTYDNLSSTQKAQTAELIGGVFQVNVLKASLRDLSKEYSLYKNALDISNNATDEAARRNEELNKTVGAQLNQTVSNLTNFGSKLGQITFAPAMKKILGGINSAIEDFDVKNPDSVGEKIGAGVLGGIGKFLEGPGLLVIGVTLVKTFTRLARQVTDAFKTISNVGKASNLQLQAQEKVSAVLAAEPSLLAKVQDGTMDIADAHRKVLYLIEKETEAQKEYLSLVNRIAAAEKGASAFDTGGPRPTTFSKGYVPNFNKEKAAKRKELASASYATSTTRAVKDKMPGVGTYYRNTAEKKISGKQFGLKQDFIVPPKGSPEGSAYRKQTSKMGIDVDRLAYSGHVPNFASTKATPIELPIELAEKAQTTTNSNLLVQAILRRMPKAVLTPDAGPEGNWSKGHEAMTIAGIPRRPAEGGDAGTQGKNYRTGGERLISLNPQIADRFNEKVKEHYRNSVEQIANSTFGSISGDTNFKLDEVGFPQVRGRMFEDMIQGLAGNEGAANTGVDLAKGLSKIRDKQGRAFIDKHFIGVTDELIDAPIEIRSSRAEAKSAKLSLKAVTDMVAAQGPDFPLHPNMHFNAMDYMAQQVASGKPIDLIHLSKIQEKNKGAKPANITAAHLANLKYAGHIPNFKSAKGRKTPLYDLDGTIIKEGFFDWNNPEKVSQITQEDLTGLGKQLASSKELVDIATARDKKNAAPIRQALTDLGINVGKVMPLASMFKSQKKPGIRKPLVNLTGPDKKRLIAEKLDRSLIDNEQKNIDALGPRGILYDGASKGYIPNYLSPGQQGDIGWQDRKRGISKVLNPLPTFTNIAKDIGQDKLRPKIIEEVGLDEMANLRAFSKVKENEDKGLPRSGALLLSKNWQPIGTGLAKRLNYLKGKGNFYPALPGASAKLKDNIENLLIDPKRAEGLQKQAEFMFPNDFLENKNLLSSVSGYGLDWHVQENSKFFENIIRQRQGAVLGEGIFSQIEHLGYEGASQGLAEFTSEAGNFGELATLSPTPLGLGTKLADLGVKGFDRAYNWYASRGTNNVTPEEIRKKAITDILTEEKPKLKIFDESTQNLVKPGMLSIRKNIARFLGKNYDDLPFAFADKLEADSQGKLFVEGLRDKTAEDYVIDPAKSKFTKPIDNLLSPALGFEDGVDVLSAAYNDLRNYAVGEYNKKRGAKEKPKLNLRSAARQVRSMQYATLGDGAFGEVQGKINEYASVLEQLQKAENQEQAFQGMIPNFAPLLQKSKTYGPWQAKRLHEGNTKIGVDPSRFEAGLKKSTDGWGEVAKDVHDRIKTKLNVFTHGEPGTLKQLQQNPSAYETDPEIQKFFGERGLSSVEEGKKSGFVKGGKKKGGLGSSPDWTPVDYMEFTSQDGRQKVENFARGGEVSLKSAYDKRGFENRPAREVVRKSLEHMFRGSPVNYKNGTPQGIETEVDYVMHPDNLKDFLATMSGGFFPNFATGLYDSDRLPSGVNRNSIIDAIVASGKPMHVFHGPAGAGKTTAAMSRYPDAELVTSLEQIAALNDFAVVSGTNRSKKSGEYSARAQSILNAASKITAVIPARSDLMKRRFGRAGKGPAAGDKRDQKGIEGTLRAPGTDYRLYADLKKQGKNVEVLRNQGFIPNFFDMRIARKGTSIVSKNKKGEEMGHLNFDPFYMGDEIGKVNVLEYNRTEKMARGTGLGFEQFKAFVEMSRKQNKRIYSGTITDQGGFMDPSLAMKFPTNFKALASKKMFPQLRHRLIDGLRTSGNYYHEDGAGEAVAFDFDSIKELRQRVNAEDRNTYSQVLTSPATGIAIEDLISSHVKPGSGDGTLKYSKGFVPNFLLKEGLGKIKDWIVGKIAKFSKKNNIKPERYASHKDFMRQTAKLMLERGELGSAERERLEGFASGEMDFAPVLTSEDFFNVEGNDRVTTQEQQANMTLGRSGGQDKFKGMGNLGKIKNKLVKDAVKRGISQEKAVKKIESMIAGPGEPEGSFWTEENIRKNFGSGTPNFGGVSTSVGTFIASANAAQQEALSGRPMHSREKRFQDAIDSIAIHEFMHDMMSSGQFEDKELAEAFSKWGTPLTAGHNFHSTPKHYADVVERGGFGDEYYSTPQEILARAQEARFHLSKRDDEIGAQIRAGEKLNIAHATVAIAARKRGEKSGVEPWDEENIDRFLEVANRAGLSSGFVPSFKKELTGRAGWRSGFKKFDKDLKFDWNKERFTRIADTVGEERYGLTQGSSGYSRFHMPGFHRHLLRNDPDAPASKEEERQGFKQKDLKKIGRDDWEKILRKDTASDLATGTYDARWMKFNRRPTLPEIIGRLKGEHLKSDPKPENGFIDKGKNPQKVISELNKGYRDVKNTPLTQAELATITTFIKWFTGTDGSSEAAERFLKTQYAIPFDDETQGPAIREYLGKAWMRAVQSHISMHGGYNINQKASQIGLAPRSEPKGDIFSKPLWARRGESGEYSDSVLNIYTKAAQEIKKYTDSGQHFKLAPFGQVVTSELNEELPLFQTVRGKPHSQKPVEKAMPWGMGFGGHDLATAMRLGTDPLFSTNASGEKVKWENGAYLYSANTALGELYDSGVSTDMEQRNEMKLGYLNVKPGDEGMSPLAKSLRKKRYKALRELRIGEDEDSQHSMRRLKNLKLRNMKWGSKAEKEFSSIRNRSTGGAAFYNEINEMRAEAGMKPLKDPFADPFAFKGFVPSFSVEGDKISKLFLDGHFSTGKQLMESLDGSRMLQEGKLNKEVFDKVLKIFLRTRSMKNYDSNKQALDYLRPLTPLNAAIRKKGGLSSGLIPNFLDTRKKKYKDGLEQEITSHDEKGKRVGQLTYDETPTHLELTYNRSAKRGAGFKQFQGLMEESAATGKPIFSGTLVNQVIDDQALLMTLGSMSPFEQMSRHAFPQLRHRQVKGGKTSGQASWWLGEHGGKDQPSFNFKSLRDLKGKSNQIKKETFAKGLVEDLVKISHLETTAANKTGLFKRDDSNLLSKIKKTPVLSKGFVPSFARSPLSDAVSREASAVPKSTIRVGQDNALKTSKNPAGLGVYNTIHEPRGLKQGVQRARTEGKNPKTYGTSKGLIPSFADTGVDIDVAAEVGLEGLGDEARNQLIEAINEVRHAYEIEAANAGEVAEEKLQLARDSGVAGDKLDLYTTAIQKARQAGEGYAAEQNTATAKLKRGWNKFKDSFTESKDGGKLEGRLLALSIAVPQVTEIVKNFGGEGNKTFNALTDSVSQGVSMFTGVTSMFPGPSGKAVAGILGIGGAASSLAKSLQNQSQDMAKAVEQSKEKFTVLQNALTGYAQAFSEYEQAAADPNSTGQVLLNLQNKLTDYMNSIPSKFALQIGAVTNAADLESKIAEIIKEQSQQQIQAEIGLSIQTSVDEVEGVLTGLIDLFDGQSRNLKQIFQGSTGELKLNRMIADMRKGIDFRALARDMGDNAKSIALEKMNRNEFINVLGDQYNATAQLQLIMRDLANSDLKKFKDAILESARAAERQAEAVKEIEGFKEITADDLGISDIRDSIELFKTNLAAEVAAMGKLGGGFEGFMDPKAIVGPINDALRDALSALVIAPQGAQGDVQRARGAMGIMQSQMDFGTFIPGLQTSGAGVGTFDAHTQQFFDEYDAAAEKQFQAMMTKRIQMMTSERATLAQQGKDTSIVDSAIQRAMKTSGRAGTQQERAEAGNFRRRARKKQFEEQVGIEEVKPSTFRIALSEGMDPTTGQAQTNTLGQGLDAKNIVGTRQRALVVQQYSRKIQDEMDQYQEAIAKERQEVGAAAGVTDEATARAAGHKDLAELYKREAALKTFQGQFQTQGLTMTMEKLREGGKLGIDQFDPNAVGGQFLAGMKQQVSVTGDDETPAERMLRQQMEALENQEKLLTDAVKAQTKVIQDRLQEELLKKQREASQEVTGGTSTMQAQVAAGEDQTAWQFWKDSKLDEEGFGGARAEMLKEMYKEAGRSDVVGEGGVGGDVADFGRWLKGKATGGRTIAKQAIADAATSDTQKLFSQMAAIMPEIVKLTGAQTGKELAEVSDSDLSKAIKNFNIEAKAAGRTEIAAGDIEGLERFVSAAFETAGTSEGKATASNLGKLITLSNQAIKDDKVYAQTANNYLATVASWNNPRTAAVTFHGDKIGLVDQLEKNGKVATTEAEELKNIVARMNQLGADGIQQGERAELEELNNKFLSKYEKIGADLAKRLENNTWRDVQDTASGVLGVGIAGGTGYGLYRGGKRGMYGALDEQGTRSRNLFRGGGRKGGFGFGFSGWGDAAAGKRNILGAQFNNVDEGERVLRNLLAQSDELVNKAAKDFIRSTLEALEGGDDAAKNLVRQVGADSRSGFLGGLTGKNVRRHNLGVVSELMPDATPAPKPGGSPAGAADTLSDAVEEGTKKAASEASSSAPTTRPSPAPTASEVADMEIERRWYVDTDAGKAGAPMPKGWVEAERAREARNAAIEADSVDRAAAEAARKAKAEAAAADFAAKSAQASDDAKLAVSADEARQLARKGQAGAGFANRHAGVDPRRVVGHRIHGVSQYGLAGMPNQVHSSPIYNRGLAADLYGRASRTTGAIGRSLSEGFGLRGSRVHEIDRMQHAASFMDQSDDVFKALMNDARAVEGTLNLRGTDAAERLGMTTDEFAEVLTRSMQGDDAARGVLSQSGKWTSAINRWGAQHALPTFGMNATGGGSASALLPKIGRAAPIAAPVFDLIAGLQGMEQSRSRRGMTDIEGFTSGMLNFGSIDRGSKISQFTGDKLGIQAMQKGGWVDEKLGYLTAAGTGAAGGAGAGALYGGIAGGGVFSAATMAGGATVGAIMGAVGGVTSEFMKEFQRDDEAFDEWKNQMNFAAANMQAAGQNARSIADAMGEGGLFSELDDAKSAVADFNKTRGFALLNNDIADAMSLMNSAASGYGELQKGNKGNQSTSQMSQLLFGDAAVADEKKELETQIENAYQALIADAFKVIPEKLAKGEKLTRAEENIKEAYSLTSAGRASSPHAMKASKAEIAEINKEFLDPAQRAEQIDILETNKRLQAAKVSAQALRASKVLSTGIHGSIPKDDQNKRNLSIAASLQSYGGTRAKDARRLLQGQLGTGQAAKSILSGKLSGEETEKAFGDIVRQKQSQQLTQSEAGLVMKMMGQQKLKEGLIAKGGTIEKDILEFAGGSGATLEEIAQIQKAREGYRADQKRVKELGLGDEYATASLREEARIRATVGLRQQAGIGRQLAATGMTSMTHAEQAEFAAADKYNKDRQKALVDLSNMALEFKKMVDKRVESGGKEEQAGEFAAFIRSQEGGGGMLGKAKGALGRTFGQGIVDRAGLNKAFFSEYGSSAEIREQIAFSQLHPDAGGTDKARAMAAKSKEGQKRFAAVAQAAGITTDDQILAAKQNLSAGHLADMKRYQGMIKSSQGHLGFIKEADVSEFAEGGALRDTVTEKFPQFANATAEQVKARRIEMEEENIAGLQARLANSQGKAAAQQQEITKMSTKNRMAKMYGLEFTARAGKIASSQQQRMGLLDQMGGIGTKEGMAKKRQQLLAQAGQIESELGAGGLTREEQLGKRRQIRDLQSRAEALGPIDASKGNIAFQQRKQREAVAAENQRALRSADYHDPNSLGSQYMAATNQQGAMLSDQRIALAQRNRAGQKVGLSAFDQARAAQQKRDDVRYDPRTLDRRKQAETVKAAIKSTQSDQEFKNFEKRRQMLIEYENRRRAGKQLNMTPQVARQMAQIQGAKMQQFQADPKFNEAIRQAIVEGMRQGQQEVASKAPQGDVVTKTVATGHDKDGNPVQVNVGKDGQTQQVADVQKVEQKTDVNVNVAEIKVTHAGSIRTPLDGKNEQTIKALGEAIVIAKGDGDRLAAELNKKLGAPKTDTA